MLVGSDLVRCLLKPCCLQVPGLNTASLSDAANQMQAGQGVLHLAGGNGPAQLAGGNGPALVPQDPRNGPPVQPRANTGVSAINRPPCHCFCRLADPEVDLTAVDQCPLCQPVRLTTLSAFMPFVYITDGSSQHRDSCLDAAVSIQPWTCLLQYLSTCFLWMSENTAKLPHIRQARDLPQASLNPKPTCHQGPSQPPSHSLPLGQTHRLFIARLLVWEHPGLHPSLPLGQAPKPCTAKALVSEQDHLLLDPTLRACIIKPPVSRLKVLE